MSRRLFLFAGLALACWFAAPSGMHGQVAREGAYYNPYTGTSAAGREAYNPYTGTSAQSSSRSNPYTGRNVSETSVHNPYTGNTAEVRHVSNPYTGRSTYSAGYRR
jgi:hypothetical protein